jgi:transposase
VPKKKCLVILSDDERQQLEQLLRSGTDTIRKVTRARILLKAAEGWEDSAIAEAFSVGRATVERLRQRFIECRLGALAERPRPGKQPKLDEKAEARLIAEAYSATPTGRQRWTLQLLADRVVALGLAESYSYESVRRVLKKRSQAAAEAAMAHPRGDRRPQAGRRQGHVTAQRLESGNTELVSAHTQITSAPWRRRKRKMRGLRTGEPSIPDYASVPSAESQQRRDT